MTKNADYSYVNKVTFAETNYAYMHDQYCHVAIVTNNGQDLIFREVEGNMCRSIYSPIFINNNVSHNVRLDGQGFFYTMGNVLVGMLQGEAVKNIPDYNFPPIPNL